MQKRGPHKSAVFGPPTQILDGLYVGSVSNATCPTTLKQHGITHVLSVAEECPILESEKSQRPVRHHIPIAYFAFNAEKKAERAELFDACSKFIQHALRKNEKVTTATTDTKTLNEGETLSQHKSTEKAANSEKSTTGTKTFTEEGTLTTASRQKSVVLVHCSRGRSRSVAVLLAFLVKHHNMTLKKAYLLLKEKRPFIGPHFPLRDCLIAWEEKHHGSPSLTPSSWHNLERKIEQRKRWDQSISLESILQEEAAEALQQSEQQQQQNTAKLALLFTASVA